MILIRSCFLIGFCRNSSTCSKFMYISFCSAIVFPLMLTIAGHSPPGNFSARKSSMNLRKSAPVPSLSMLSSIITVSFSAVYSIPTHSFAYQISS